MSDLTTVFNDLCDNIRSVEKYPIHKRSTRQVLNDTFQQECNTLKLHLGELNHLIFEIRPLYLSEDKELMSEAEIKQFNDDVKIQLKDYTNKYNFLNLYETKRIENLKAHKSKLKLDTFISKTKYKFLNENNDKSEKRGNGSYEEQVFLSEFRRGCLAFINHKIVEISEKFADLQKERFVRDQKSDDLDFNVIHEKLLKGGRNRLEETAMENIDHVSYTTGYSDEMRRREAIEYEEVVQQLTQEQIQELEVENSNILNEKDHQLKELNEITSRLFEISSLTNELNLQLSQQSQNIDMIMENQDSVNLELKQANRQLNSKSGRMNFSAVMVSYMAIILGIIILFLDYIN
ncbi:uncharacterized protein HGUI_00918 [Hanseniaspora guilliermondii]|uniref:t-SNARE coiled-coil homology domain-containing protein n=1 Tax=Hanseniaspora guilliermondii TaxID=56406 RepID=A0A1L0FGK1_9ASCO|nr:uncharacterized protein HGUI_00918 [Hanseniaspora guilliermondii]